MTTWEFLAVSWCVDGANGGVHSSGGDKISVFCDEAGECWLQHRDGADSVCFASQWRRLHTASNVAVSGISCQSEWEKVLGSMPSHFPP